MSEELAKVLIIKVIKELDIHPHSSSYSHAPLQGTSIFPFLSSSYMVGIAMMLISFLNTFKINWLFISYSFRFLFSSYVRDVCFICCFVFWFGDFLGYFFVVVWGFFSFVRKNFFLILI